MLALPPTDGWASGRCGILLDRAQEAEVLPAGASDHSHPCLELNVQIVGAW
jgi:hypothetical protein